MSCSKRFVFRISLECPRLAIAELESIIDGERLKFRVVKRIGEFVIADTEEKHAVLVAMRAALLREFGPLRLIRKLSFDIEELVKEIRNVTECIKSIESARAVHRKQAKELFDAMKRYAMLSSKICCTKVVLVDGHVLVFDSVKPGRKARFSSREPHKRPVYLPGTMTPWLARVFVNLAAVSSLRHELLLDPFCGVGGFALECGVQGIRVVCGDVDPRMVSAAARNIVGYDLEVISDIVQWDASLLPFRGSCVDGIATDPPYGRMSFPRSYSLEQLIDKFIDNSLNTVRNGRRIVFAVPLAIDDGVSFKLKKYSQRGLCSVLYRIQQYVHSSLTRVVYVVKKL